ncbi:MAG: gliding motility-associated protein GldE [Rikenellaceae bacterium]
MGTDLGITFNGFNADDTILLSVTVLLLMFSALVSGAEAAFFSFNHNDISDLKRENTPRNNAILELLSDVDLLLATILVVNNLVNICISIMAANLIDSVFTFGRFEFLFKMVFVTFLLLLFGEIAPKVLAQTSPVGFARMAARPLKILRKIFYPLSVLLLKAGSSLGQRAMHHSEISLDELADAVDMTESATKEEKGILSGILNFINTEVQEIMRSRVDMVTMSLTEPYAKVRELIIESGYSRIPVHDENLDNICGILYVKDLLPYVDQEDVKWQQLMRKPYFVPEHKKINDLLGEFQNNKVHVAIVVDEYGSTLGLVSLEDIIEEIVGEISDESDNDEKLYTRLDQRTYIFEGKTHIGDFERIMSLDEDMFKDTQGDAETLAGLILEIKRSLPKLGDSVTAHSIQFTVEAMGGESGRRIEKIRVLMPQGHE